MCEFVSDWIGKPLLTRGGECIGYVKNVQTDRALRRVRNLECVDGESEEEFLLPASAVAHWGRGALVAARRAQGCKNCLPAPFGIAVYSETGEALGPVDDFVREGLQITALRLADGTRVPVGRLQSLADTAIVGESEAARPLRRAGARKAPAADANAPDVNAANANAPDVNAANANAPDVNAAGVNVKNMNAGGCAEAARAVQARAALKDAGPAGGGAQDGIPAREKEARGAETAAIQGAPAAARGTDAAESATAAPNAVEAPARSPARKRAGNGLLTGKVLPQDLTDVRGNVLAARGTVVTAEVIRRALRHDKLFALTLLCANTRGL